MAADRQNLAGKRPEPPLHPVADDGVADLLGNGETGAHCRVIVAAVADEKNKAGSGRPPSGVGGEKVRPLADYD